MCGRSGDVASILSRKVDIDQCNRVGETAIHLSCSLGDKKTTKALLRAGANPLLKNNRQRTAIDLAREAGHHELATYVESKLSPQATGEDEPHARPAAVSPPKISNRPIITDSVGRLVSPPECILKLAPGTNQTRDAYVDAVLAKVRHGRLDDISAALASGLPIDAAEKSTGHTMLHAAAQNNQIKVTRFLLEVRLLSFMCLASVSYLLQINMSHTWTGQG